MYILCIFLYSSIDIMLGHTQDIHLKWAV